MKHRQAAAAFGAAIALLGLVSFIVLKFPAVNFAGYGVTERPSGFFTVFDENNVPILETGLLISQGDQFLTSDDRFYEIARVSGDKAYARAADIASLAVPESDAAAAFDAAVPAQAPGQKLIGLYHTHSDESYVPTSGKSSKPGKGDIFAVGDAFAAALQQKGFAVSHDKTPHDPHDAGAYKRSRRTATKLFKQRPFALFDVHRDSAPGKNYSITIDGTEAQRVMIVIGRQNPKMSANLGVARAIKATADKKYPNLIRAIFMAKGGYNQDLASQAILFEFGTEKLPLEQAKRSTAYIADAVAATFGVAPAPAPAPAAPKLFGPAAPAPGTPSPGKYVAPQQK